MTVYLRADSGVYSYDFQLDGKRHSGSTGKTDVDEARAFERAIRSDAMSLGIFCRAILKRARHKAKGRRSKNGYVYMLQSGYFIKIGHSHDPVERIRSISTATPDDCELLFCIPGTVRLERKLHAEFEACHHKREWFFLCGKLKQFVSEIEVSAVALEPNAPREIPRKA
ncbi:GIY-YIG nuclease family protein [Mesorhizobium sp. M0045]|uniref:GIY-YIG nuclease family protein n=1 Tax=Mesorhizobium sp. M0045 TaxID=2956857 RepID=UPI00333DAC05